MNKVLFVSAHTDDSELACGATITRLIEEGSEVRHIAFSCCKRADILAEFQRSNQALGISDFHIYDFQNRLFSYNRQEALDILWKHKRTFDPQFVFTHGDYDINQDHQVIHMESMRAFKDRNVIGYNHAWNVRSSKIDFFVRVNQAQIDKKILALKQYETQAERHYFNPEYIESQARSTAAMLCLPEVKYAEGFQILNYVL